MFLNLLKISKVDILSAILISYISKCHKKKKTLTYKEYSHKKKKKNYERGRSPFGGLDVISLCEWLKYFKKIVTYQRINI